MSNANGDKGSSKLMQSMKARAKRIATGRGSSGSVPFFRDSRDALRGPLLSEAALTDQIVEGSNVSPSPKTVRSGVGIDRGGRNRIRDAVDSGANGRAENISSGRRAPHSEVTHCVENVQAESSKGYGSRFSPQLGFSRYSSFDNGAEAEEAASGESTNSNSPQNLNSPDSSEITSESYMHGRDGVSFSEISCSTNSKGLHFSHSGNGHSVVGLSRISIEGKFSVDNGRGRAELSPRTAEEYEDIICQIDPPDRLLMKTVLASTPQGQARVRSIGEGAEAVPSLSGEDLRRSFRRFGFTNLPQLIPVGEHAGRFAISRVSSRAPLMHEALLEFVKKRRLSHFGIGRGDRCGVLLPNGPEAATCLFVCMSRCACVPININQTSSEIRAELIGTKCCALIVAASENRVEEIIGDSEITVLKLRQEGITDGLFDLSVAGKQAKPSKEQILNSEDEWNKPEDIALILHTSGTSGKKKIVPYTLESIVVGSACIAHSWKLSKYDICLNMMPLFHVGGISRNIFAAILSGGGTVCAAAFDASQFWDCLDSQGVTWYYAGPTMHHVILEERKQLKSSNKRPLLRFIANASGGLLETLALRMRDRFRCPVLPCYGMTECMPISCPPLKKELEYPGASGQVIGPRVRIMDELGKPLACGLIGNIAVKGMPTMLGYEGDEKANMEAFYEDKWFSTGDMGFVNKDGWITITGRSKEVINRGGEIISPFEVEEALVKHERVREVIAFAAPHAVLQEVVGVVVVPEPGKPRVDLLGLQKFVAKELLPAKWPQVLVFMRSLPKGQANKAQRIRLAERLGMTPLTDGDGHIMRTFEAEAPSPGTPLNVKIPMQPVTVDLQEIMRAINEIREYHNVIESLVFAANQADHKEAAIVYVTPSNAKKDTLLEALKGILHDYMIPKEIIAIDQIPRDHSELPTPQCQSVQGNYIPPRTPTEHRIQHIWNEVLGKTVSVEADFFENGGSSLLAGRLVSQVRSNLGVPLTAASLFTFRTISALSEKADKMLADAGVDPSGGGAHMSFKDDSDSFRARIEPKSQNALAALIVQLLPLCFVYPLRRVATWITFISIWIWLLATFEMKRLYGLILALLAGRFIAETVLPLIGILCKWIVIGRYKPGRYPLWGQYYLRWWFVDQFMQIMGRGIYREFEWTQRLYYRALGAKIGKNVHLDRNIRITEFDLISIGDDTVIDKMNLAAFCLDHGAMQLASVNIGEQVTIPQKVAIAPGIDVPSGTTFGPLSSSYEMETNSSSDKKKFCKMLFPVPPWYLRLLGSILCVLVWCAEQFPVLMVLRMMVMYPWYMPIVRSYHDLLVWFLIPQRIGYYVLLRVVRQTASPVARFLACVAVKWIFVGRFTPGKRARSKYNLFRYWLMEQILPGDRLQDIAQLVGNHYEGLSWIYRLLGAKIGKRIYWPGSGFEGFVEYDLFEVGDDVVFGSRTLLMPCDAEDASPIRIQEGAFVGDRCVLLPGCTIERNAVLGTGGMGAKDFTIRAGSKWVGSKNGIAVQLEAGTEAEAKADTIKPFGRAMYLRQANYFVIPWIFHGLLGAYCRCFAAAFRALTITMAFVGTAHMLEPGGKLSQHYSLHQITQYMVPLFLCTQNLATIGALLIAWISKWVIMGRRKVGEYDWDKSSYCQRWQIYLQVTHILRNAYFNRGILEHFTGSAYLVWWFRAHGGKIGKNVCLYPRAADPMMTEPELVEIGDKACIDNASMIAHINARGFFSLNHNVVGPEATLRSWSRLLSGAAMMPRSMLLEHTCVLGGDVVDEDSVWQGWPGEMRKRRPFLSPPPGAPAGELLEVPQNLSTPLLRE